MRRHHRNHTRKPSPPPQPTNAYPVISPAHHLAAAASSSSSPSYPPPPTLVQSQSSYRYPSADVQAAYPSSPPTPPYTNEPGSPSPPRLMLQGGHPYDYRDMDYGKRSSNSDGYSRGDGEWDDEMYRREARRVGRSASHNQHGMTPANYFHEPSRRSAWRGVGGQEHQQPSPDTPSLRHLHPSNSLSAVESAVPQTPNPGAGYPYTYQQSYSSTRSTAAVATTSDLRTTQQPYLTSNPRRSGSVCSDRTDGGNDLDVEDSFHREGEFAPSAQSSGNTTYPYYTYPPPTAPASHHYHSAPLPVPVQIPIMSKSYSQSSESYTHPHSSYSQLWQHGQGQGEHVIPIDPALETLANVAQEERERVMEGQRT